MYYVYVIQPIIDSSQIYVGCTESLEKRLLNHNTGSTPHTSKFKPWKLVVYIAFDQKDQAYKFEEYLKSGSGREFRDKRLLSLPKNISKLEFSQTDLITFINFASRRFGVYLDTIFGFYNNIEKINSIQQQFVAMLNKSVEELDQLNFINGDSSPPNNIELMKEKTLCKRTQGQFKIDNSQIGINGIFAIHNCLTDIYNQWKLIKNKIGIDDNDISAIVYISQLRNRTQHELYDDKGLIKANSLIEMQKPLSKYMFPRFNVGDYIILSHYDCIALIKEMELQLNEFLR